MSLRGANGSAPEFDHLAGETAWDQASPIDVVATFQSVLQDYVVSASVALGASGIASAVNSTFDIVVNYSGDPMYQSAFTAAVARWSQIITADIPDYTSSTYGFIDDLVINASIIYIDGSGGILGQAGPDELRSGSYLPGHGIMQFDSSDVATMYANGTLTNVILHEMGHVLGIGSLWDTMGLKNSSGDYVGAHALAEYRTLSGNAGATSIPVEHDGGSGTAGAHWDEETFGSELMTGYAQVGAMPISRMTIGSLQDMGYTVNYGAADPYTIPGGGGADDYADSLNDGTAPYGAVAVNGSSTGTLERTGDHDWFQVVLTAGVTYTITLRGSPSGNGTLADPYLQLHNSSGVLLLVNDDVNPSNIDSSITYTATSSGIYYINAGAYHDAYSGTYRINVTGPSNQAPTNITATALSVNENAGTGTLAGTLTAQDPDNTSFTYSLLNNAGGRFSIDNLGRLTVLNGLLLDCEQAAAHTISVRATDAGGLFVDRTFSVTVNDVNPENVTGDNGDNIFVGGNGNDTFYGMGGVDSLSGGSGNDYLDGGSGADTMYGGGDNDAFFVDNAGDLAVEYANAGTDTVYATAHFRIGDNIENLVLQGTADLQGYGNSMVNVMYGNAGANLLDGGAGADAMYGGGGNDSYFVDNPADVIYENVNEGFDTVYAAANLALGDNIEILVMQGTGNYQGYGNALVNVIYGNAGNNILNGGSNADTMYGGAGNDAYFVDNPGDLVIEYANEGIDDVYSSANLVIGANIEYLHLTGTDSVQGYGNALNNILVGNSGDNLLDGRGGTDTLYGYGGNDTFFFRKGEASGDIVVDFAGNGAGVGDRLLFADYGAGATFTQVDATHWQVNYNGNTQHEVITFSNAAAIHASDYAFM